MSDMLFANIFPSTACLSNLLQESFVEHSCLIFMKPGSSLFPLGLSFAVTKRLTKPQVQTPPSMLSFRKFIVLHFTVKSTIPFQLVFI